MLLTLQGLGAFALITLGVMITRYGAARQVIRPRVFQEVARAGLRLLPMFLFMSAALGLVVIGQTVSWLTRVGAINYLGTVMVVVVVRELGPLVAALLVLALSLALPDLAQVLIDTEANTRRIAAALEADAPFVIREPGDRSAGR